MREDSAKLVVQVHPHHAGTRDLSEKRFLLGRWMWCQVALPKPGHSYFPGWLVLLHLTEAGATGKVTPVDVFWMNNNNE